MEKILEIKDHDNLKFENEYYYYEGYEIITNKNKYLVLVDNNSNCCESFGHISSPDKFEEFIGSEILKVNAVEVTEDDYKKSEVLNKEFDEYGPDCLEAAFIQFETTNGTLEFAVYNDHNGYYGHDVLISKESIEVNND